MLFTILVSVISTLVLVSIVGSIVVIALKLKGKVDDVEAERLMTTLSSDINEVHRIMREQLEDVRRHIDSRCDKLDSKINKINE